MDLPGGIQVNQALVLEAENMAREMMTSGDTRNWQMRIANRIFGRRNQYPYGRNPDNTPHTISRSEAFAIARWTELMIRGAEQMNRVHGAGELYEGELAFHPGLGPGYHITAQFTVHYTDGRAPSTIYQQFSFRHNPTSQEVIDAIDEAAGDYAFVYGAPGVLNVANIQYTRAFRGQ